MLRLITGLEFPQCGSITLDDGEIEPPPIDCSIVFQSYSLFPWLTVEGNIKFALKMAKKFSPQEIEERTDFYLERVGLSEHKKKYPFQLSGGMRQRTAIARSLAIDSKILLLDEPFGALDIKIRRDLQKLVRDIWEEDHEKTIVFVTHDISEALSVGNRIVFLKKGKIESDILIGEEERSNYGSCYFNEHSKELLELEKLYE